MATKTEADNIEAVHIQDDHIEAAQDVDPSDSDDNGDAAALALKNQDIGFTDEGQF